MELTVNGVRHDVLSPPLTTLLNVLREELLVTSPKAGCEQGGCGACTVHVDGRPRRACLLPLAAVEGAEITTVEGLSRRRGALDGPGRLPRALRRAVRLLHVGLRHGRRGARRPDGEAGRDEIIEALSGHVCRCTGYAKIIDAVAAASRGEVGVDERPRVAPDGWSRKDGVADQGEPGMKAIGARLPRYDGVGHVTGRRSTSTTCACPARCG